MAHDYCVHYKGVRAADDACCVMTRLQAGLCARQSITLSQLSLLMAG